MNSSARFRRQYDPQYKGSKGEIIDGDSMTQPDMTLTVGQLLENHTRNMPQSVKHVPGAWTDAEVPKIRDLTDLQDFKEYLEARKKELTEQAEKELWTARNKQLEKEAEIKPEEGDQ